MRGGSWFDEKVKSDEVKAGDFMLRDSLSKSKA
jgi:hypothetical protein